MLSTIAHGALVVLIDGGASGALPTASAGQITT